MKMNKKNRKGYAYGSMVRSPMQPMDMSMSANPMMDRKDKMGMTGGMGMMYGGKAKKGKTHEQQESASMEKMERRMKGYRD